MMPEPSDVIPDFCCDITFKIIIQLIAGTGKHEVLPYQKSQLITDIKEIIIRIITAAPDPDTVMINSCCIGKKLPGSFFVYPGEQIILRDIVCTHGKDLHAIHFMGKALTPFILICIHRQGTESDPSFIGIQHCTIPRKQSQLYLIKRLLSVASRPPELRICYNDMIILRISPFCRHIGSALRICYNDLYPCVILLCKQFKCHIKVKSYSALFVLLRDIHRIKTAFRDIQQGNLSENTSIREPGTPVPSKHTVCLSKMWKAFHGIPGTTGIYLFIFFLDVSGRRMKLYPQGILPLS